MTGTKIVVLLGRPGSGKGTQADLLRNEMSYTHLSTGEILRAAIREKSELGLKAQEYVDAGRLVPDALIVSLVTDRLRQVVGVVPGVICDGFPRTVAQASALGAALEEIGVDDIVVIELRLSDVHASQRIQGREASGAGERSDDKESVVAARMAVFEAETSPVIDFYEGQGLLKTVDASGTREDVFSRIRQLCGG